MNKLELPQVRGMKKETTRDLEDDGVMNTKFSCAACDWEIKLPVLHGHLFFGPAGEKGEAQFERHNCSAMV